MEILKLTDTFSSGIYKGEKVEDIVDAQGVILNLIKEGFYFDDEVLVRANITKNVRDVKIIHEFVEKHIDPKDKLGELPKETASMKQILKDITAIGERDDEEETKVHKEDKSKKILSANDYFEEEHKFNDDTENGWVED